MTRCRQLEIFGTFLWSARSSRVQSKMTKLTWSQCLQEILTALWAYSHSKGSKFMINRRVVLGMIAAATTIDAPRMAFAKEKHPLTGKDLLGEGSKSTGKAKTHTTGKRVGTL